MSNIFLLNDNITNGFSTGMPDIIYALALFFALCTIYSTNPIVAVLFLIGLFISIASLLILIGYNFIGLSYLLVYMGVVSILFFFILMLINLRVFELTTDNNNSVPLGIMTGIFFTLT